MDAVEVELNVDDDLSVFLPADEPDPIVLEAEVEVSVELDAEATE